MLTSRDRLRHRLDHEGSGGFTLIEIIVAIAVLAIIIVPLTMAFIGVFTNTQTAREALDRNNDAQRIAAAWTSDVQSVLPGGVNPEGAECIPPQVGTAPESSLITFQWTTTVDGETTSTSTGGSSTTQVTMVATWVAVGTDTNTSLWRRECMNGTLVASQRLAANVGESGQQGIDVFHGPDKTAENPEPHTARSFCPYVMVGTADQLIGKTCTIVVDGSWHYDLEVTRRVPDITDVDALRQAPPAPRNLTGTPRNLSIVARFESPIMQPGQPPVDRYRVRAIPLGGGSPIDVLVGPGDDPMLVTIDGLTNSQQYMLRVQAHNAVGWGDWTDEVGPFEPLPTEPNAPTIVSVTPGDQQVEVRFRPPDNDGGSPIIRWHLYAQTNSGTWVNESGGIVSPMVFSLPGGTAPAVTVDGDELVAVFTGLENGTAYHFHVAGVNAVHQATTAPNPPFVIQPGEGLLSERSLDVTPYGPPDAPGGVEARGLNPVGDVSVAQINIRWSPPADPNGTTILGYRLYTYKGQGATTPVDADGEIITIADAGCTGSQPTDTCQVVRTYTVTSAQPADYYRYSVKTLGTAPDEFIIEGEESAKSMPYGARRPEALADYVRPSRAPDAVTTTPSVTNGTGGNLTVTFTAPYNGGEPIEAVRVIYRTRTTASGSPWSGDTEAIYTPTGTTTMTVSIPAPTSGRYIDVRVAAGNRGEWTTTTNFRFGGLSANSAAYLIPGIPGAPAAPTVSRPAGSLGTEFAVSFAAPADTGGTTITGYDITCSVSGQPALTVTRRVAAAGTHTVIGVGSGTGNSGQLRDGAPYTCNVKAINAQGTGSAGASSAVATAYGECRLDATETHYMIDGSGDQNGTASFQVSDAWNVLFTSQKQRWGAFDFSYNATCKDLSGNTKSGGMPTTAKVKDAYVTENVTTSRNRRHRLVRATSTWNEATPWSSRPSVGGELANWCVDSTGTKTQSGSGITAAVDDMVRGNSPYGFVIQDTTNCGVSIASDPAVYAGRTSSNPPRLYVTKFYTQGDY